MIALAVQTGIAPAVWIAEGIRAIDTAGDVLKQQSKANAGKAGRGEPAGRQMSG